MGPALALACLLLPPPVSGQAPPVGESSAVSDNARIDVARTAWSNVWQRGRERVIADVGELSADEVRYDVRLMAGVVGGQHRRFDRVPEGGYAGTQGAEGCIGLILRGTGEDRSAYVFHFTAGDDPYQTLRGLRDLPRGARAALLGGNGERASNATLARVMAFLRERKIPVDGYSVTTGGLWLGSDGRYYRTSLRPPT